MFESQWNNPLFQKTALIVFGFILSLCIFIFPIRKKNTHLSAAWASLQSWLFFAPILLALLAAGGYWPLILIVTLALLCAKEFFQLTGIYHLSIFVWLTYLAILGMGYMIDLGNNHLYNIIPMLFLGFICLIPILQNSFKNMLQYISLSLLCCLFLGWGFMHMAWILKWKDGFNTLIYIILLSEFCDNVSLAVSRLFGRLKLVDQITPKRTVEGFVISSVLTIFVAWWLKYLLPSDMNEYWLTQGLVATLVGTASDLFLSVIRRDLGVKDVGIFIIGRGGLLDRMDRLIFVAPVSYYILGHFKNVGL